MNYPKTEKFDQNYVIKHSMGPNPLKLLEELLASEEITPGGTILDLGCGCGLTSMFAAREYSVRVFASDLWIAPTDNKRRFDEMGYSHEQIIPLLVEAHAMPFAEEFFDAVICVDSYHYYGLDPAYLQTHLLPLVKHGARVYIVVPGLVRDIHDNIPPEMRASWRPEDIDTLHDIPYWRQILSASQDAEILSIREMEGYEECWNDWLTSDNEYAVNDRKAMQAGAGKYMNMIAIVLRKK